MPTGYSLDSDANVLLPKGLLSGFRAARSLASARFPWRCQLSLTSTGLLTKTTKLEIMKFASPAKTVAARFAAA